MRFVRRTVSVLAAILVSAAGGGFVSAAAASVSAPDRGSFAYYGPAQVVVVTHHLAQGADATTTSAAQLVSLLRVTGSVLQTTTPRSSASLTPARLAAKAESEGVDAAWGVSHYRHGGVMSTIEHINYRHAYESGFANVSRFSEGTSVRDIKSYVDAALRHADPAGDVGTINYDVGRVIGTDQAGNAVTGIRVHVRDGIIKSAYPVAP